MGVRWLASRCPTEFRKKYTEDPHTHRHDIAVPAPPPTPSPGLELAETTDLQVPVPWLLAHLVFTSQWFPSTALGASPGHIQCCCCPWWNEGSPWIDRNLPNYHSRCAELYTTENTDAWAFTGSKLLPNGINSRGKYNQTFGLQNFSPASHKVPVLCKRGSMQRGLT